MKTFFSLILLLAIAPFSWAQSITFDPPSIEVEPRDVFAVIPGKVDGGPCKFKWDLKVFDEFKLPLPPSILSQMIGPTLRVKRDAKPGTYEVWAWNAKAIGSDPKAMMAIPSDIAVFKVVVLGPPEPPTPPTPPDPPQPPSPTAIFEASGTQADQASLLSPLKKIFFPWEELRRDLKADGKTKITLEFADLNKYKHLTGKAFIDGREVRPYFMRALRSVGDEPKEGIAGMAEPGRIWVERSYRGNQVLVDEIVSAEIAHEVDWYYLESRNLHDKLTGLTPAPFKPWWWGNYGRDYFGQPGESWMHGFGIAYSDFVTTDTRFTHQYTRAMAPKIRAVLGLERTDGKPTPEPEPSDEFFKSLQSAWQSESAADKTKRADLAALYRQSVNIARNDKSLATVKNLFDKMHAARVNLIDEALPSVRAAITERLNANLPRLVMAPLDDATRQKAASEFDLISRYLEKLQ